MWNCNNPYLDRNENLRRMGFDSYRGYLASDLWKSIKARAIEAGGRQCARCGQRSAKRLQVHHRSYDLKTLVGTDLRSLSVVCGRCHALAEQPSQRRKYGADRLSDANDTIMLTRATLEDLCWNWYLKHKKWVQPLDTPTEARVLVTIYQERAQDVSRCAFCGSEWAKCDIAPKVIDGRMFCGRHFWGQLRPVAWALKIRLDESPRIG